MSRSGTWWVSLALAGCYAPSTATGVPCDPLAPACPAGQLCVPRGGAFVCDRAPGEDLVDAGPDGPDTNDLDGDGVPNALDNCPTVPNPSQANEDGLADPPGDACDPCPPLPGGSSDLDGDGVGDLCDPHLLIPGDQITLFEGFSRDELPAGWVSSGSWTVDDGTLISAAVDNDLNTLVIPYTSTARQTISANVSITALTQDAGGSIGVVDQFDAQGVQGIHCGGGRAATVGLLGLINAGNGSFLASTPHPFDVGTLYRLTFQRTDDSYACSTIQAGGTATMVDDNNVMNGGPFIGMRNRIASASYAWVMVVKSP